MKHLSYKILIDLNVLYYTEGPVFGNDDEVYFTTLDGGTINRLSLHDGTWKPWATGIKPNGQWRRVAGDHLVCEAGAASIARYAPNGDFKGFLVEKYCDATAIQTPNDLAVDSYGGVYFTDSVRHVGQLCYFNEKGGQRILWDGLDFPNGVALDKDENRLFIAESFKNRILCLPLQASGVPAGPLEVFADLPIHSEPEGLNLPDGIKLHPDGSLWVAHYGMSAIQVLDIYGIWTASIPVDFPLVSNLAINDNLFVVTGGYGEPGPGRVLVGQLI